MQNSLLSSNSVTANTTTFAKDIESNDRLSLEPNYKFKPEFATKGSDGSTFEQTCFSYGFLYFLLIGEQNTDPTGYFRTTQHLQDYYWKQKTFLWGPFTETHVGGYQYRHNGLQVGGGAFKEKLGTLL